MRKLLEVEQKSRLKAAKLEVRLQQDQNALKNQRTIYCDEREQLCAHVSMLKKRLNCLDESALKNSQQTIKSLQKKLEMSEAQVCDLVPLARDAVRSRHEANQTGILVVGKDRRIAELESRLERSTGSWGENLKDTPPYRKMALKVVRSRLYGKTVGFAFKQTKRRHS